MTQEEAFKAFAENSLSVLSQQDILQSVTSKNRNFVTIFSRVYSQMLHHRESAFVIKLLFLSLRLLCITLFRIVTH